LAFYVIVKVQRINVISKCIKYLIFENYLLVGPSLLKTRTDTILWSIKNSQFRQVIRSFLQLHYSSLFRKKRSYEYKQQAIFYEEMLSRIFNKKMVTNNFFNDLEFHIENFVNNKKNFKYFTKEHPYPIEYGLQKEICRLLSTICFYSNPDVIVETGIAYGFSSAYVLLALKTLKKGKLISIDGVFRPWETKEKIGEAIPTELRNRHEIIFENNTISKLDEILRKTGKIDIFIHDSLHIYSHMMKEYCLAWPYIKEGGFLISDDVFLNDAFLDFANKINHKPFIISIKKNLSDVNFIGIIKKESIS